MRDQTVGYTTVGTPPVGCDLVLWTFCSWIAPQLVDALGLTVGLFNTNTECICQDLLYHE